MINKITLEAQPDKISINPSATAIIVVDMQNAFARKGGYFDLIGFDISRNREDHQALQGNNHRRPRKGDQRSSTYRWNSILTYPIAAARIHPAGENHGHQL